MAHHARGRCGGNVRSVPLGKTVDSADDMARLMIVTQYAGSDTVKVYASNELRMFVTRATKAGYISLDGDDEHRARHRRRNNAL